MEKTCVVFLAGLLAGCGSLDFIGLGSGPARETAYSPANATEYRCAGGPGFWLRNLEGGAIWLIAPDRELRLEPVKGAGDAQYAVGRVQLSLDGDAAKLVDPPGKFDDCKKAPPPKT